MMSLPSTGYGDEGRYLQLETFESPSVGAPLFVTPAFAGV